MLRILFVLLLAISSAQAAHITDKLLVGLYAKPDPGTQPVKVLPSGTPLEVLETKKAFSKVRLGDGKEGWVKSVYISNEKPARAMLLELQAKSSTLKSKLREAEKKLKTAQVSATPNMSGDLDKLKKELTQTREKLALADSALKNEQKETKRLMGQLKKSSAKGSDNQSSQTKALKKELTQAREKLALAGSALKNEQKETKRLMGQLKKSSAKGSDNQSSQIKALKKKLSANEAELSATLHEARLLQDLLKKTDQTASQRISSLEQELLQTKDKLDEMKSAGGANPTLMKQNTIMKQRLKQVEEILGAPIPELDEEIDTGLGLGFWIPAIILLIIGGFFGGVAFKNHRIRRRYGGFRI